MGASIYGVNISLWVSVVFIVAYVCLFLWGVYRNRIGLALSCVPHRSRIQKVGTGALYWLNPILFVAIWGVVSLTKLVPSSILPSPIDVAQSFATLLASGVLLPEVLASVQRIVIGFSLAAAGGVPLGLAAGAFIVGRQLVNPINSFMRYIPPTAFIALMIVYFGVGEAFKVMVVFFGVIFFIVQMIIDVVDDVDARYVEIALTSGLSNGEVFRRVIIPYCLPKILDVLRVNLGAAWTFLVAAELIGAQTGLGHFIAVSQRFLRLNDLYAGILTFGVIGLVTDFVLERLSRRIFPWYYIALKR